MRMSRSSSTEWLLTFSATESSLTTTQNFPPSVAHTGALHVRGALGTDTAARGRSNHRETGMKTIARVKQAPARIPHIQ